MTTTIDIVVCLDCSSSITSYYNQIRFNILSIVNNALVCSQSDVRMALIESRSHTDYCVTNIHPFTSSMDTFQEWIDAVQTNGGGSDDSKAIVDALGSALTLDWRPNVQNNTNQYHEKLVILITDGPPCGLLNDECPCDSQDLWVVSDEFEKQDITLTVVGVEPSIVVCEDFYCALANKTGGEYIPLINASRVLSSVIQRAILGEDTLSQLFRHLNIELDIEYHSLYHYSYVQKRARFMIESCRTMTDIRRELFTHRRRSTKRVIDTINEDYDDNFEPHSPLSNEHHLIDWQCPDINIITSTPLTDDEGYRTRLPTVASANSSFTHIVSSPFSLFMELDWSSENDDDCF